MAEIRKGMWVVEESTGKVGIYTIATIGSKRVPQLHYVDEHGQTDRVRGCPTKEGLRQATINEIPAARLKSSDPAKLAALGYMPIAG